MKSYLLCLFTFIAAINVCAENSPEAISIAISGSNFNNDPKGVGAFVFEVLQAELSGRPGYELVDRKRLQDLFQEQRLGAGGMTGDKAAKFGKLVGVKYYVFGETLKSASRFALNCRVVQVESGIVKPVILPVEKDEDPMAAGAKLASLVTEAISKLEGRSAAQNASEAIVTKLELAPELKRPVLAFRIPEATATPQARTADPAAEKSLEAMFLEGGFKLVQLSRPSQSVNQVPQMPMIVNSGASLGGHLEGKEHEELLTEARGKGVEVIVLGIATSQRATQIGNFIAARARVELAAVRTSDSRVLATTSGYGVATDLSDFVAEKKAIESATKNLQVEFAKKMIAAFNAK